MNIVHEYISLLFFSLQHLKNWSLFISIMHTKIDGSANTVVHRFIIKASTDRVLKYSMLM